MRDLERQKYYAPGIPQSYANTMAEVARQAARYALKRGAGLLTTAGAGGMLAAGYAATRPSKKRKTNSMSGSGSVVSNRTNQKKKTKVRKSKGKGKKSLKTRVKALEKHKSPLSHYTAYQKRFYYMNSTEGSFTVRDQVKKYFFIPGVSHQTVDGLLGNVEYPSSNVDLRTSNTATKVANWSHLYLKNNSLKVCHLKYCEVDCADDSSVGPLSSIKLGAEDRGYANISAVVPEQAATASVSSFPSFISLSRGANQYQLMDYIENNINRWKKTSKVNKVILNPGDELHIYPKKSYTYRPEISDDLGTTYLKKYDYGVVFEAVGELGVGVDASNKVGLSDWLLSISKRDKCVVTIDNGLGLNVVTTTSDADTTTPDTTGYLCAGANNVIE